MQNGTSRAEYILQELQRHRRIDAEQLSQQLHVNASTIRRDLEKMERQRLLRRIHTLVTDRNAPDEIVNELKGLSIEALCV